MTPAIFCDFFSEHFTLHEVGVCPPAILGTKPVHHRRPPIIHSLSVTYSQFVVVSQFTINSFFVTHIIQPNIVVVIRQENKRENEDLENRSLDRQTDSIRIVT